MDTLRWLRKNGNIIGCEIDKIEISLIGIARNEVLHQLYHEQLEKDSKLKEERNGIDS